MENRLQGLRLGDSLDLSVEPKATDLAVSTAHAITIE